jgi:hypothetical protein
VLKAWQEHDLLEVVNPVLAKKHPDYDAINRLSKVRDDLMMAGFRPRLAAPMLLAILGKLKDREQSSVLSKAGFRSAEIEAVLGFEENAMAAQKELTGRKTQAPIDAFRFIEKLPLEQVAYLLAESTNSGALSKIRAYLNKWRPIRTGLPVVANELEALGMARGARFDEIVNQMFAIQLTGRGKTPEERVKILRKLSGIKEQPKKKEKEKKAPKAGEKPAVAVAAPPKDASKKPEKGSASGAAKGPSALAKHLAGRSAAKAASARKKAKR